MAPPRSTSATVAPPVAAPARAVASMPGCCGVPRTLGSPRRGSSPPPAATSWPRPRTTTAWKAATLVPMADLEDYLHHPEHPYDYHLHGRSRPDVDEAGGVPLRRSRLGNDPRPHRLHRLQCLSRRLPRREQRAGGGQGAGAPRSRDALDPHRPLLTHRRGGSGSTPSSTSRCPACTASRRPARWSARWRRRCTATKASTTWSTTAVSAPATARTTAPTRCGGSTSCSTRRTSKIRPYSSERNPDVTVRSRGVMEKCTYCVQRINAARIVAKREDRRIRDGEVVTACQGAVPERRDHLR